MSRELTDTKIYQIMGAGGEGRERRNRSVVR